MKNSWAYNATKGKKYLLLLIGIFSLMNSCRKMAEVDTPVTAVSINEVFENNSTAIAAVTGIYMRLSEHTFDNDQSLTSFYKKLGLSADEFGLWNAASDKLKAYYTNNLIVSRDNQLFNYGGEMWDYFYQYIFQCNAAIEGLLSSKGLTLGVKNQLIGEAKFLRAFFYFYLVNAYGDLPKVLSSDYQINLQLKRSAKTEVYNIIIGDLKAAKDLLSDKFVDINLQPYASVANSERARPCKWAATALLARVYLYTGLYTQAEAEATQVIDQSAVFNLVALNNVFLKNSSEAIWQLQPVNLNWNTEVARSFVLSAAPVGLGGNKEIYLSNSLVSSFEPGDGRCTVGNWVGSYTDGTGTYIFPYKYKSAVNGAAVTEYLMMLRLAEQFLIRAEARVLQDNISGAVSDLNAIRTRARATGTAAVPDPLPALMDTLSKSQILTAVLQERRVELFAELGHRWFDLKRTGAADSVMSIATAVKGGEWQSDIDPLYPISYNDIIRGTNLVQNHGY